MELEGLIDLLAQKTQELTKLLTGDGNPNHIESLKTAIQCLQQEIDSLKKSG
jgi:hypothetical protein